MMPSFLTFSEILTISSCGKIWPLRVFFGFVREDDVSSEDVRKRERKRRQTSSDTIFVGARWMFSPRTRFGSTSSTQRRWWPLLGRTAADRT